MGSLYENACFFISNVFFGLGSNVESNVAWRNSKLPKIGLTLPEKKEVKNAIYEEYNHLEKGSCSLVLNILRDLCFRKV